MLSYARLASRKSVKLNNGNRFTLGGQKHMKLYGQCAKYSDFGTVRFRMLISQDTLPSSLCLPKCTKQKARLQEEKG